MKQLTVDDVINAAGGIDAVHQIWEKYGNRYFESPYVEKKPIFQKLRAAHHLGLHDSPKKTILDIGTGAGWWPFICGLYGHDCVGIDLAGRVEYDAGYKFLGITVPEMLVYAGQPINFYGTYDIITSFRAFFPQRPQAWVKDEWKFFFNDIKQYLNNDGFLFLGTNSGSKLDKRYKELPPEEKSHWGEKQLGTWFEDYVFAPETEEFAHHGNTLTIYKNDIDKLLNT
jgi:cyclopropane fatty-acyl-phospholipid synthase-like methyltransferase